MIETFFASEALAHVKYVVEADADLLGPHWSFFGDALLDPLMIIIIVLTAAVVLAGHRILIGNKVCKYWCLRMRNRAQRYDNLIGWMLRLSLGIALVGAGISRTLISPAVGVGAFPMLAGLEFGLGFLLLIGFLIEPAALFAIGLYVVGAASDQYLFGSLEFAGAAVALLMTGNSVPGLDDILGIRQFSSLRRLRKYLPLVLRVSFGAGLVFLAVYEKLLNPWLSAEVVRQYHLTSFIPVSVPLWVLGVAIVEILLGFLLMIGFYTRVTAAIIFLVLTGSFFFFGEAVYAHVVMFGVLSVLFVTGAGRVSVDEI